MKVLITGCAGFIGFHLASRLLEKKKYQIYGIDNLNTYYDLKLKEDRLKILKEKKYFKFKKIDITNTPALNKLFKLKFDYVNILMNLKVVEKPKEESNFKQESKIINNPKCLIIIKKKQKISRNERCEATGKKFKNCCGAL